MDMLDPWTATVISPTGEPLTAATTPDEAPPPPPERTEQVTAALAMAEQVYDGDSTQSAQRVCVAGYDSVVPDSGEKVHHISVTISVPT